MKNLLIEDIFRSYMNLFKFLFLNNVKLLFESKKIDSIVRKIKKNVLENIQIFIKQFQD